LTFYVFLHIFYIFYCIHGCVCQLDIKENDDDDDDGSNGTEFSYVIFTEQRNFTTAERRNGNGRTATEWWKPGITVEHVAKFGDD